MQSLRLEYFTFSQPFPILSNLFLYSLNKLLRKYPRLNIKKGLFQLTITCSKSAIETLEQGVKYVQS